MRGRRVRASARRSAILNARLSDFGIGKQRAHEMRREIPRHTFNGRRTTKISKLRHLQPHVTAGMDAAKGLQIHVDVEREPVVARTAADANTETRKLAFCDV